MRLRARSASPSESAAGRWIARVAAPSSTRGAEASSGGVFAAAGTRFAGTRLAGPTRSSSDSA